MTFLWIATSPTSFSTSSLGIPSVNLYLYFISENHILILVLILLSEVFVGLERLEVPYCDPAVYDVNFLDLDVAHIVLKLPLYISKVGP